MASLLCNRIDFTHLVDKALIGSFVEEPLKNVQFAVSTKRTIAIKALRSKLSKSRRVQLNTLTTLFKEQLDVIRDLLATTKPAQVWANECRFYTQPTGTVVCKCGKTEITLDDHFPARQMLVVTPLTRVVRRVYFQTRVEKGYLWLHGPPGTGKTETAKDTAAMLGREFRVFNCSAKWNLSKLINDLDTDVTHSNADPVLLFDSFGCLTPYMQRACIAALTKAGRFAVFTGKSPPSVELTQNYKLTTQAMEVPCYEKIAQVMLGAEGFVDCDALGTAMYECMQACQTNCSKQPWYDFGLRAYKACIAMSGVRGRATGFANETKLVCDTLGVKLFSLATARDTSVVLAAAMKAFGRDPVLPKEWTSGSREHALPAIVQAISQTRHGVCVVGLSDAKAEACITAIKEATSAETIVVPHNILSKKFNNSNHPLVTAMRRGAQTTAPVNVCVKVDRGCGGDLLYPLRTLLDDNRKLILDTTETIALPRNMRLIFFVADCSVWSPATVSRLGMVCGAEDVGVDWKAKYEEVQVQCVKLQKELDTLRAGLAKLIPE